MNRSTIEGEVIEKLGSAGVIMRDLPGFFYDEDKGKYFPIHLKEAYEKERRASKREQGNKLKEASEKTTDLYKFIGNSPLKFDSVSEKISRIKVTEIIWPNNLQIDPENDFYYRYNWQDGHHNIQHIKLSTGEEVDRLNIEDARVLLKFGGIYTEDCSKYYQFFIFGNGLEGNMSLRILTPGNQMYSAFLAPNHTNFDLAYHNDRLYYCSCKESFSNVQSIQCLQGDSLVSSSEILSDSFDFLVAFPETGLIQVHRGGILIFKNMKFKLTSSSAKCLYYYEGKLLILTCHGQLLALTLKTKEQETIFNVNDFDFPDCICEDLIIDSKGKVVVIGYKNKKELIFLNWVEKKIIKKVSLSKSIEQFKISSNLLNLYIRIKEQPI